MAQEEPPEVTRTAHVKAVAEFVSKNNRHYHKVEFADGKSVTIFDPEIVKAIHPNMDVEYTVVKNERSGYWDLKEIAEARPKDATQGEKPPNPDQVVSERGRERFLDDRERSMRSMNALTNATTLLAALIDKEIVRPSGVDQTCAMVGDLHHRLLAMHDPRPQGEDGA